MTHAVLLILVLGSAADPVPPPAWFARRAPVPPPAVRSPEVRLVMFGASRCGPCREMRPMIRQLQREGHAVIYADAESSWNAPLLRAQGLAALPAWVMYRDRKPISRIEGERLSRQYIVDWLARAREDKLVKAKPLTDPLDVEYFQQNHWRLAPGSCGMAGCTRHGGGWVRAN